MSANGTERGAAETPRSIRLGDAFARTGQDRKLVDMQAGALQALVQSVRRLRRPRI